VQSDNKIDRIIVIIKLPISINKRSEHFIPIGTTINKIARTIGI
jgi:hypothetical protein